MTKLWSLLRSMVSGMPSVSASPAARTQALVLGARAYLAKGHEDYLNSIVQNNRAQVCTSEQFTLHEFLSCHNPRLHALVNTCTSALESMSLTCGKGLVQLLMRLQPGIHRRLSLQATLGGSPTQLGRTKAFIRVKEKDRGPLDFDVPGGADTTWQRVYLCLRSGFAREAIEVLIIPAAIQAPPLQI